MRSILVTGEPALWSAGADERSVAREKEWKNRIKSAIGDAPLAPSAIHLHFAVKEWLRRGHHFDLDNLVTPVFRAIYGDSNRDRADARAALSSWRAVVGQCPTPFLLLDCVNDSVHESACAPGSHLLIDKTWMGPVPTNSREADSGFAFWIQGSLIAHSPSNDDRFAVHLTFGTALRDLTRPEEKPIKPVIDCLYPIFGGGPARGEDWKKVLLQVERSSDLRGTCHIRCWRLSSS